MQESRNLKRKRRHIRLRKKINGSASKPRLNIFKSNKAIYVQFIDDNTGVTLASASSLDLKLNNNNIETCIKVGELAAKNALAKGINEVVFDRGGYLYHGKIKALADACRNAGLKF